MKCHSSLNASSQTTADDGGFFFPSLWYVRPSGTHALMFRDPSTALLHRGVHTSHPVRHRSHVDLPAWKAKENSKRKLFKQMTTKKKFPPLKGCFESIWSVWWLLCDSYHLCLSKQGTYRECHVSAQVHHARQFSTVTQFLVYPCTSVTARSFRRLHGKYEG